MQNIDDTLDRFYEALETEEGRGMLVILAVKNKKTENLEWILKAAGAHERRWEFKEAAERYHALAKLEREANQENAVQQYENAGRCFKGAGNYALATQMYREAEILAELLGDHERVKTNGEASHVASIETPRMVESPWQMEETMGKIKMWEKKRSYEKTQWERINKYFIKRAEDFIKEGDAEKGREEDLAYQLYNSGIVLLEQAIKALQGDRGTDFGFPSVHYEHFSLSTARSFVNAGDEKLREKNFLEGLKLYENAAKAYQNAARTYLDGESPELEFQRKDIELAKRFAGLAKDRGIIGEHGAAIECYQKAFPLYEKAVKNLFGPENLTFDPNPKALGIARLYLAKAQAERKIGIEDKEKEDREKSNKWYGKVLNEAKEKADALFGYAEYSLKEDRMLEAARFHKSAVEWCVGMAEIYREKGDIENSIQSYERAGRWTDAAKLAEEKFVGRAITDYEKGGNFADVARLCREKGHLLRAVQYENLARVLGN
ncbi:MAG TPA: hypothetical protein VJI46_03700 [Candidatus Nanoarchaeia archaeon]|nr:hypothetical protein [Candidatus Nanoarchaeia archaeon]